MNTNQEFNQNTNSRAIAGTPNLLDVKVMVQPTPNPSAFKYIVNREVKSKGKATFNSINDCAGVNLAKDLFSINGVQQLYFFDNVITVTFLQDVNVLDVEDEVIETIKEKIAFHNPIFSLEPQKAENKTDLSGDLKTINEILDRTIRPHLQGDGGDLELVSYKDNELMIQYQGACGSCPSATMGTLMAIEGVLRDEFDPDITVIPV